MFLALLQFSDYDRESIGLLPDGQPRAAVPTCVICYPKLLKLREHLRIYMGTMAKAMWEGAVLADSNSTVEVEGNQYFPPDAIRKEYFKPNETHTVCPWKGTASYYDVEVNGKKNAGG